MAIQLDSISQIPQDILSELISYNREFVNCEFVDQLLKVDALRQIAAKLNNICRVEGVIGYHYTRAVRQQIAEQGLTVGRGADRRREFISVLGVRFTAAQRERIVKAWNTYFDNEQTTIRDGRLFFNFTLSALDNGGADRLLTYFGGEAVYMPLTEDEEIANLLRSIGEPLIVKAVLPTNKLQVYFEEHCGRIWLSSYHVSINTEARQDDTDARICESVPAVNIASIETATSWQR